VEAPSASTSPLAGVSSAEGRPSTGRASLLDAIKKGSGQLRKVSTEEQEALAEEKKRSTSSVGGFGTVLHCFPCYFQSFIADGSLLFVCYF
jgi:hypothetical protein